MAERPEALWIVDKVERMTGDTVTSYVFRTRHAARLFHQAKAAGLRYRYLPPRRGRFGPES